MKCKNCGYGIPYSQARKGKDEKCTLCGSPYRDDPDDILLYGKYGIAREVRPTQADMARAIDDHIYLGQTSTIYAEGGTGIGKSFAYLIPAILAGKRVVVSTAKKSLQHQLVEKDLPFLKEKMGREFTFGVYKGKNNYACPLCAESIRDKNDREAFKYWALNLLNKKEAADIAKWPGKRPPWWDDITIESCPRKKSHCAHKDFCKPQPKNWDIVVVNHTLLAIDLLSPGFLIGDYPVLVIDEAHKAPEMFRSAVTESITLWATAQMLKQFENDDQLHAELTYYGVLSDHDARARFTSIKNLVAEMHRKAFKKARSPGDTVRIPSLLPYQQNVSDLLEVTDDLHKKISSTLTLLNKDIDNHSTSASLEQSIANAGRIDKMLRRLRSMQDILIGLDAEIHEEETAGEAAQHNWIIIADDKGIHRKPVCIGDVCGPALAERTHHRVVVSATLTIGGSFQFIRDEFGITKAKAVATLMPAGSPEKVVEAVYASPFDLASQALLYTPATIIPPAHPGTDQRPQWIQEISAEIERLCMASKGDAFVLFSAKTDLNEVLATIDSRALLQNGIKILAQTDGVDAQRLTAEYMDTPSSVLFGLKSFWEGVDIPGDKLRLVILPKLPFPNPKDPIIEALSAIAEKNGDNAFVTVSIPQMLFDLKQAVGRLIRTQTDRGVVAILDSRVWTGTSNIFKHQRVLADIQRMRKFLRDNPEARSRFHNDASYRGYGRQAVDATGFINTTPSFTKAETFAKESLTAAKTTIT